jgi:hypothetical protein
MSNKTELQNNNLELSEILGDINALPNAGGGGSAPEIAEVTITENSGNALTVHYTAYENGEYVIKEEAVGRQKTIYCVDKTTMTVTSDTGISCDGHSNGLGCFGGEGGNIFASYFILLEDEDGSEMMIDFS